MIQARIHTTPNLYTALSHVALAVAGKTVLRLGRCVATEQLFQWANFQPGETVLELASGLGTSAISLAKRYNVQVIGIEKDPGRVAIDQANARATGVEHVVHFMEGNIFQLETLSESFNYVLAEAILTMQVPTDKAKILSEIRDRLNIGDKFLSHELLARDHLESLHQDLAQAMHVNATPLTETDWINTFHQVGLTVTQRQTDAMKLLDPIQVL
jgi:ubiquinone/menaquinone biosynthesis C-methylase UbiE